MTYKISGLYYIDSSISKKDKNTPRQVILQLKVLTPETKDEDIFISIKKNLNRNYVLFYKKKFHQDTLTITNYFTAIMMKQYKKDIIQIFDPYHQLLVKDVIWDDQGIPKNKEEKELDNELNQQLDWIEIMELEEGTNESNKWSLDKVEEMSIDTFATAAYGLSSKKACNDIPT